MSWVFNCVFGAAAACLVPYWLWKLPQGRRYRAGILQRLGFVPHLPTSPRLWLHCASVGEAAIPRRLVAEIRRRRPGWEIVFSTNTDTGARRLEELYPESRVFYMPLDFSFCVGRALERVRPSMVLLVELEIWPNFLEACRARHVPVAIVSGRIGRGSRRLLRVLNRLWPHLWDGVRICCARSREDAAGFRAVGMCEEAVCTSGSLKYDALRTDFRPAELEQMARTFAIEPGDPVLVAGSTHRGEEAALAGAYRDLKIKHRRLRLIIAPRHIERAAQIRAALRSRGFSIAEKTVLDAEQRSAPEDAVILLDTIGELTKCYALATCAFVGRSLNPPGGGQNMMEPAALGKPVLVGPHTGNFRPEMRLLRENDAVLAVRDRAELVRELDRLLSNPDQAGTIGRAARSVILESQGATERTLTKLEGVFRQAELSREKGRVHPA